MDSPAPLDDTMADAALAFCTRALAAFAASAATFDVVASTTRRSLAAAALQPPVPPRAPPHTLVVLDASFNPPTRAHMQMATSALHDLRRQPPDSRHPAALRLLLLLSVNNADKAPKPAAFEQRLALMLAMAKDLHARLGGDGEALAAAAAPDLPIDIGLTSEPFFHRKSNAIAASPFYTQAAAATTATATATATAPGQPEQVFLVGYDTLIRIFDPKYYPPPPSPPPPHSLPAGLAADATPMQIALAPLMRRARLRVTTRPDDQWGDEAAQRAWLQTVGERGGAAGDWAARIELHPGAFQGAAIVSSTAARAAAKARDGRRLREQVGPSVAAWVETQRLYRAGGAGTA